jgi:hypothetical protein
MSTSSTPPPNKSRKHGRTSNPATPPKNPSKTDLLEKEYQEKKKNWKGVEFDVPKRPSRTRNYGIRNSHHLKDEDESGFIQTVLKFDEVMDHLVSMTNAKAQVMFQLIQERKARGESINRSLFEEDDENDEVEVVDEESDDDVESNVDEGSEGDDLSDILETEAETEMDEAILEFTQLMIHGVKFKEVSQEEMKTYLMIWIVMGLVKMPALANYWNGPTTMGGIFGNNFISKRMGRDRWKQIHACFSADLEWLHAHLLDQFKKWWIPKEQVAVDETLVLFKGKYKYRQHIKGKPNATGLKIYALADLIGFMWDFWIYQGSQSTTKNIVIDFVKKLPSKEYTIYCDSYYGSWELADELNGMGFKFLLSCAKNRPTWLFASDLNKNLKVTIIHHMN